MKRKIEENRFGRKMMKEESINIYKEQIIKITDEMKEKFPSLENYDEIFLTGEFMTWWEADMFAYDSNMWFLPSRNELKNIWKVINTKEFQWAWTGEVYIENGMCSYRAWQEASNGDEATAPKEESCCVICLR
jgi:hypothetical protein